jgi:hypothetical protein
MEVSEQELRAMVRDAIARVGREDARPSVPQPPAASFRAHASHALLALTGGDSEGRCLIEPAVSCTHCGYCQSMGH